ncbi:MAG TPA: hypothetical protein VFP46_00945 [Candidatus Paceibacterota bacterium]|nr:hypothetical protein [Candidatus Paceibacterota bacterium]
MRPSAQLTIAGVACLTALIAYGGAYGVVSMKSDAVSALQSQIDAHTETVNRLSSARAMLAELASEESALQNYFVPQSGIVSFIDGLQALGRSLGSVVQVRSVSTGGTTARPTLSLSLLIRGPFDSVVRTIGAIEYGPYAISVVKLSLSQSDKGVWDANMDIVVGSRAETATSTSTTP